MPTSPDISGLPDRIVAHVAKIIVGNSRTDEMVGPLDSLSAEERRLGGCVAQRLLWFAGDGDMVILPWLPRPEYLTYVTGLTRTDPDSLTLLAPPPGRFGIDLLTADRICDAGFLRQVRLAMDERGVDEVLAVYKDPGITDFTRAVGTAAALPGYAFSAQGGDALVNSKAAFRSVAAGVDVPIAPGVVVARCQHAQHAVTAMLAAGYAVMLKREFDSGGYGNEILSPYDGLLAAGAPSVDVIDVASAEDHLGRRWARLTEHGRHRLVIEHYLPGCQAVYAEFLVGDDDVRLLGDGEMFMEPVVVGEVVPAQALTPTTRDTLVGNGRRLAQAYRGIGYRGYLSTDAVLTPAGDIVFTEVNGRLSGSTHLHTVIGARLVDPAHRRVRLERTGWPVPSFTAAVDSLAEAGLAYDPVTSTGVVLTSDLLPDHTVVHCTVAEDLAAAVAVQRRLPTLVAHLDRGCGSAGV